MRLGVFAGFFCNFGGDNAEREVWTAGGKTWHWRRRVYKGAKE